MTFIAAAYRNVGKGTGGRRRKWKPAFLNGVPIEPQRNNWSCGPAALRYCLLVHGIDVDVMTLADYAGSTRSGTDETQLGKAAKRAGCRLTPHVRRSHITARRFITRMLRAGTPLILCVEKWQHWIAVLHCSRRGFLVFDSSRPGPVIMLRSWKWLEKRLRLEPNRKFKQYFRDTSAPMYSILSISGPVQRRRG